MLEIFCNHCVITWFLLLISRLNNLKTFILLPVCHGINPLSYFYYFAVYNVQFTYVFLKSNIRNKAEHSAPDIV